MLYTPEYDTGEHGAVRNVADRLEEAVAALERTIAVLDRDPIGDNYDFTGFTDIIGVVCTPHVVFTAWQVVSRHAAIDLRITPSVQELAHWLEKKQRALNNPPLADHALSVERVSNALSPRALRLSVLKWEFGRAGEYGVAR